MNIKAYARHSLSVAFILTQLQTSAGFTSPAASVLGQNNQGEIRLPATFRQASQVVQSSINRAGVVNVSARSFVSRNTAFYGPARTLAARQTIAGRLTSAGQPTPKSTVVTIGESPDGFGKQVIWDPADEGIAVVIFLSAADPLGVMISGVKRTDTVEVVSSTGLASFDEDAKNEGAAAFIGIVAAGANLGAAAFGAPGLAPVIGAAAKFAKTQFKEEKVRTKRRDPFGEDPGTGLKARAEGGVLMSMPEARQAFYSGNGDHKERWIKVPGTRDDSHRPNHVLGASFLQAGSANIHAAGADGDLIIYPWDHKFEDNFGFYRLHVILKRGDGSFTPPG